VKDSPITGDEQTEGSITNYEIDKTIARIVNAPGTRRRISVSVVVDGQYTRHEDKKKQYVPRSEEELTKFTELVKKTVGYDEQAGDQVYVTSMQFDRKFLWEEQTEMARLEWNENMWTAIRYGTIFAIIIIGFLFMRSIARSLAKAMNPPLPKYAGVMLEKEEEEVPETMKRQNEMLEKVEMITRENPQNVASLIKGWLSDYEKSDTQ
jgi:flagellar M-ring protein FliF